MTLWKCCIGFSLSVFASFLTVVVRSCLCMYVCVWCWQWESFSQAVIYRWSDPDQAASATLPLTLFLSLFLLFTNSFSREVKQEALSEPAGQVAMELEGRSHSESAMHQSDHQGAESSDSHPEEVRRPTERRPSGNYNPEILWGDNWSL